MRKYFLRVDIGTIQSGVEQGSLDLADFHIYCSVFHANSRGARRFSKIFYSKKVFFVPPEGCKTVKTSNFDPYLAPLTFGSGT